MADQRIRVLIIDDVPETRENLKKLLMFEHDMEVVGAAATAEEGIRLAKELQPDVVLLDINLPGMSGISAVEQIMEVAPLTQVVMMSVQSDTDYLRRAMLAGARDFLAKPFSADELVATVRRVHRRRPPPPVLPPTGPLGPGAGRGVQGKVVAVYSPKGGVGTTLIAVNLAVALQKPERRVALIDASLPFGDIGVFLNLQGPRSIADLARMEEVDPEAFTLSLLSHASGLKVLLAPPRPELAEYVTAEAMKQILNIARTLFDIVVIDTTTQPTETTLLILDEAEQIVLVVTPDVPTIKNARLFFDVITQLNYPPQKTLMILNKMDRRFGISAEMVEQALKHPVSAQIPWDEITVLNSINKGAPLVAQRSKPIAQAILQLAGRVEEALFAPQEVEEVRKRGGR
ncbi:Transcriptional regulatory protein DegU [Candidatus Thermoflexus japonica]|uniref:Transcriptional regulatory protein DegU n=1 Tax=Candidatus Thermoflexus japonica TaxID=2035417 RepID=A0A2H5Y3L4_9CHLR|nr:Transcriptional regulatory protein DegU [Candidatus Thermoflexus japonica]